MNYLETGSVSPMLTISNTGTGDYFPACVTPKVVAEAYQENARGKCWKESRPAQDRKLIKEALGNSVASHFTFYTNCQSLPK